MGGHFFIRNDDVWTLDKGFRFFFDLAEERGIPVVHAVIPGKTEKALARFLCSAKEKTPGLVDIVQHGWMHMNHSVNAGAKYEFGASRPYAVQREDIRQGMKKMRAAFGGHFIPAFVPPYHGYDEHTLQVLQEEGFRIFSAGDPRPGTKKKLVELPAQVSFSRYDRGQTSIHKANEVVSLLLQSANRRPLTGVLTHHADFKSPADRCELTRFFDSIASLKTKKGWQVLSWQSVR